MMFRCFHVFLFCFSVFSLLTCGSEDSRKDKLNSKLSDEPHMSSGQHNAGYDHDAFLGPDGNDFDHLPPEESKRKLGEIVDKVDLNNDGFVSTEELSLWITKMSQQITLKDVNRIWSSVDLSEKDLLTFENYVRLTYGEGGDFDGMDAEQSKKEIEKEKRRWDVSDSDKDGKLSQEEALAFLHPELHPRMREILIQETIDEMDKNGDGYISVDEYIDDLWTPNADEEKEPDWVTSEREEFTARRDKNGDGKLDAEEIGQWLMPGEYNPVDAEVKHLFSESDNDQDGRLTKDEILNRYDLFVGSQVTNFGEALSEHDEL